MSMHMSANSHALRHNSLLSRDSVLQGAEEQIAKLMQQHQQEMRQRDDVLRRCRDTILGLEAKLAGIDIDNHGCMPLTGPILHGRHRCSLTVPSVTS